MFTFRRTLCALAIAGAPLGSLCVAAAAQADPGDAAAAPVVTSVIVDNAPRGNDGVLATNDNGVFFTNDHVDADSGQTDDGFTVAVTGDPTATEIDLSVPGGPGPMVATPDVTGTATFHIASLPAGITNFGVWQKFADAQSETNFGYVISVGNPPTLFVSEDDLLPTDVSFGINNAVSREPVQLFIDGELAATADARANEGVELAPTDGLTVAHHTVRATTIDAQGYTSDMTDPVGFYVQPPAPHVVAPACDQSFAMTCFINHGDPQIDVSDIETGALVTLLAHTDEGENQPVNGITADDSGTVTLSPSTSAPEGAHHYIVRQAVVEGDDERSVVSDDSEGVNLDVNTAAPELTSFADGGSTSDTQPMLSFDVPGSDADNLDGAKVRIFNATTSAAVGDAALLDGRWQPSTPLADGHYSYYAVSIDDFGHVGTAHSNTVSFTVGTTQVVPTGPQNDGDGQQNDGDGQMTTQPTTPTSTPVAHIPRQPQSAPTTTPAAPTSVKLSSSTLTDTHPVKLAFTVSKPGTVTLTLTTKVHGKTKVVGTVTVKVTKAGKVSYTLKTKFAGHKLGKGSYTLSVQSVSGSHHSQAVSVAVKVGKPKH